MKFAVQLIDFGSGLVQGFPAGRGDPVKPPPAASSMIEAGFQQAGALQSVQKRIESAWANAITVMLQFLHHRQPEDRLLRGMEEHVDSNQPVKKFPLVIRHTINYTSAVKRIPP